MSSLFVILVNLSKSRHYDTPPRLKRGRVLTAHRFHHRSEPMLYDVSGFSHNYKLQKDYGDNLDYTSERTRATMLAKSALGVCRVDPGEVSRIIVIHTYCGSSAI